MKRELFTLEHFVFATQGDVFRSRKLSALSVIGTGARKPLNPWAFRSVFYEMPSYSKWCQIDHQFITTLVYCNAFSHLKNELYFFPSCSSFFFPIIYISLLGLP